MEKRDILKSFQTQFDPTIPPILQRTSCGIASLYMGLSYLGKEVGKYPTFLQRYIHHGSYNVPTYSMSMNIAGIDTKVPISYFGNGAQTNEQAHINSVLAPFENLNMKNPITREVNEGVNPKRAFTIEHGFDHRG
ncbi:hypothetical protein KKA50_02390, partial [Patescibacteria group bacterium]|nr:hypothetical protein [Patescibacteria group bacterium]